MDLLSLEQDMNPNEDLQSRVRTLEILFRILNAQLQQVRKAVSEKLDDDKLEKDLDKIAERVADKYGEDVSITFSEEGPDSPEEIF